MDKFIKWIYFLFLLISITLFISSDNSVKIFQNDCLILTLSENWTLKEMPGSFDKSTIGWLNWTKDNSSSILIFSHKGPIYDYNNIRIRGLKILQENYPLSQKMINEPKKVNIEKIERATVELWLGSLSVNGQTVTLQSPMAIIKNKGCWLLIIGFTPETSGESFYKDFLELLKMIQ